MNEELRKFRSKSLRLPEFDYSAAGAYFVTICTHRRQHLFGEIVEGQMQPNDRGRAVEEVWLGLPHHYSHIVLDEMIVMPNHVHGIIYFVDASPTSAGVRHGLPEIIRAWKSFTSRRINQRHASVGTTIWQKDYFEHVIRDEESLNSIREYIQNNPLGWETDPENVPDA